MTITAHIPRAEGRLKRLSCELPEGPGGIEESQELGEFLALAFALGAVAIYREEESQ